MHCPECAHDNPQSARFCSGCGNALPVVCHACGHENPVGARFCNACGVEQQTAEVASVATASKPAPGNYTPRHLAERILTTRSALEGERKRVTVLFADVKGSTELAEQVGDEQWHQILDRFFSILTSGVHRYEGTINQYTGDGIMALFGAPLAHEDHAVRACRAALEMQTELRDYADELRLSLGLNLSIRTGLNSGEVVVGKIGDDLRMDYTAKGHTVNLAARMEQIAEPGRIYLTRFTASLVEGYFQLRDLGAMPIKGIAEPVNVYELLSLGTAQTRLDVSRARGLSRFIGRQQELQQLDEALQGAIGGEGQVVAVIGNGGIGKSRLCFELAERARIRNIPVYSGSAVPYANALPLYPVLGLLRSFFGLEEGDSPAGQRRKIAGTLALLKHDCQDSRQLIFEFLNVAEADAPASVIPAEQRQQRLFEMICNAIAQHDQPCVILIEDLHWADAGSEAFLAQLSAAIRGSRSLLLLNYRPEYMADWLTPALDQEIAVTALTAAELGQLSTDLLGTHASLVEIARQIQWQGGGNPFFVEEAVRSLAERGYLEGEPGGYCLVRPVDEAVIPDTVQGILAARIDRLDQQDKDVLEHAAVIGAHFSRQQLAALLADEAAVLDSALQVLEEGGFVHSEETPGDYAFCHPLTQEVAYRSQLNERRARIHARLAVAIEAALDDRPHDERSLLLAYHWTQAEDALKAGYWEIRAASYEGVMRESSGALIRYRRAIDLLDAAASSIERDNLAIQARAGVVRSAAVLGVPPEETRRAFEEGMALAEKIHDQSALAELLIAQGSLELQQGDADVAVEQISRALQIAREMQDAALIARFRIPILLTYFAAGRLQDGLDILNEPGQSPWYSGPMTEDNFASRAFRGLLLAYMGRLDEARAELRQAIEVEGEAGRTVSWMHANLVDVAWVSGRADLAMHEARLAVERAEIFASPFFLEISYRALAVAQGLNGNWSEALRLLEEHRPWVEPGQPAHQFEAVHLAHQAEAYWRLGRNADALRTAQQALASAAAAHTRIWACHAHLIMACILRDNSQPEEAAQQLDQLDALIEETGAVSFTPFANCQRASLIKDEQMQNEMLLQAMQQFEAMGADGHAQRLRKRLAGDAVVKPQLTHG